ncbi:M56 family metallopeptidase [Hyunsoonleella rubra]|uniref:M56 family metallopeptidase n=1 Tax=Hyunsoonleella rubra TaxID=1737062 RepID=A0ABW5TA07_9FLAO
MLLMILKSSACLAILMLFYKLCLEKTSAHTFKRFYLISIVLLSACIPFVTYTVYVDVPIQTASFDTSYGQGESIIQHIETAEVKSTKDYLPNILWGIYALGVILFSIRFCINLYQLIQKIRQNPKHKSQSFWYVLLNDLETPHSFFSYIFLNKSLFEKKVIPEEILLHEQTHAIQKHSLDILFIEILQIVFWFNPLLFLIKKDIKLNHEFIADRAVLKNGADVSAYQNIMLEFVALVSRTTLSSRFNFSPIRKRFAIMKNSTSKKVLWVRNMGLLLLVCGLVFGFGQKNTVKRNVEIQRINLDQIPPGEGVSKSMMKEFIDFNENFKRTRGFAHEKLSRIQTIYKTMTAEQRNSIKDLDLKWMTYQRNYAVPQHPSQEEFDSWKKTTNYVFHIDGKPIPTSELNKYSPKDIYSYTNKFAIDGNPDNGTYNSNNFMLLTKEGYRLSMQDNRARSYNKALLKYKNEIEHFLNSENKDDSELKLLKHLLDDLYNDLQPEDFNKFNIRQAPEIPSLTYTKPNLSKTLSDEIVEYNTLAKKYNDQNVQKKIFIKSNEIRRLYFLYENMTDDEKNIAEPFPYFHNKSLEHNSIGNIRVQSKERKSATPAMMQEYNAFMDNYEKTKRIHHDELRRAIAIYKIMTKTQQATVKMYPDVKSFKNPEPTKLEQPTQTQLEQWQNDTDITISIDAHRIKNIELKNYNPNDFVFYRMAKSAKSKHEALQIKKPNSCALYTKDGYENIVLKANYNSYHKLYVRYLNEIEKHQKGDNPDASELLILKKQLDNLYGNFSEKELESFKPRKAPKLPSNSVRNASISTIKNLSKNAKAYNILAKKYNNPNPNGQRYPRPEIDKLFLFYNLLSEEEKESVEIFPNLPYPVIKQYEIRRKVFPTKQIQNK